MKTILIDDLPLAVQTWIKNVPFGEGFLIEMGGGSDIWISPRLNTTPLEKPISRQIGLHKGKWQADENEAIAPLTDDIWDGDDLLWIEQTI